MAVSPSEGAGPSKKADRRQEIQVNLNRINGVQRPLAPRMRPEHGCLSGRGLPPCQAVGLSADKRPKARNTDRSRKKPDTPPILRPRQFGTRSNYR